MAADLQVIEPALAINPSFAPTQMHTQLKGLPVGVKWLQFSDDGKRLLVSSRQAKNGVQLWNVGDPPSKIREWQAELGVLSGDGQRLLVRPEGKQLVIVVDPDTDQTIATTNWLGIGSNWGGGGPSWSFSSPDLLISTSTAGFAPNHKAMLYGWSLRTGKQLFALAVREFPAQSHRSALFSQGRELALVPDKEDAVDIWDVTTQQRTRQVRLSMPIQEPTWDELFANSTGTLIAGKMVRVGMMFWDGTDGHVVAHVTQGMSSSRGAFVPGRDVFLAPSNTTREDKKGSPAEVVAFDVRSMQITAVFRGGHDGGYSLWIDALAVSANGKWLATGDTSGQVRLWDLTKLR